MIRLAINGFGRIGRSTAKILIERFAEEMEIVAINDLADSATLAHLFKHDSCYGIWNHDVEIRGQDQMVVDGKPISMLSERDPAKLPWKSLKIDVVLECTGIFRTREMAQGHFDAGAKKVVLSAPAKDESPVLILGVNEETYDASMDFVSNGSCTTNCLAPVVKVLEESFGIEKGFMTTVHSFTADQRLKDAPHKDLRRARNATESIVPTTTGAATTVTKVIPRLKGCLDGLAFRVPTSTVSVVDFVCELKHPPKSVKEVHEAVEAYKQKHTGIMDISYEPLVSIDYRGNPHSSIVDALSTNLIGNNMLKIVSWYDNEWGYSNRLAELALYVGSDSM